MVYVASGFSRILPMNFYPSFRQTVPKLKPRARSSGMNRAVASTVCRWSLRGADSSPSCMTMMSPAEARAEMRPNVLSAVRGRHQLKSHSIQPQPIS